ncbi:MAG: alpha/beta hydrolase [Leptospiraceae bacterium]|nr:alpha/beta hydrolase [Leptospiraceae bacterium]
MGILYLQRLFRRGRRFLKIAVEEDVTIALAHWPARGSAVLCLHGLTANHKCWVALARLLQKAGYDVYAPDLRGRGQSSRPKRAYGSEVHVADCVRIMSAMGHERFHVVAHSFGCSIALELAARYPQRVRSLVLMDGGGVLNIRQKFRVLRMLGPSFDRLLKTYPNADAYLQQIRTSPMIDAWSGQIEEHFRYELEECPGGVRCNIPPGVIETEMAAMGGSVLPARIFRRALYAPARFWKTLRRNNRPPYTKVPQPVLVLVAGKANLIPGDQLLPENAVRRMRSELPDCRSLYFPELNHYGILIAEDNRRDEAILKFLHDRA